MSTIITELAFLKERFSFVSVADILLVALIIFVVLKLISASRANLVMRGLLTAFVLIEILSLFINLPAFNWLISKAVPAFVIMIPIVFAPEIRHAFERVGRIRSFRDLFTSEPANSESMYQSIDRIVEACRRLSSNRHGALIVMEYFDRLDQYVESGVKVDSILTSEMLLQIFYPNTPLHDGAVIIRNGRIYAASCVMPLSSRNVLDNNPERHMGLRHRAGLGTSEATDSVVIVVSEETGTISLMKDGELSRGLSSGELKDRLRSYYHKPDPIPFRTMVKNMLLEWKDSDSRGGKK